MSNSFSQLIFNKIVEFNKYRLRDIKYYSVDDLFTVRDYVRGFNNNKKKFLQTKFQAADYTFGRLSIGDIILEDTRFSPRYSKYFVQCDKVLEDFKQFQSNSSISNVQVAPPLIEEDLCLFKDKNGVEYKVEIRGVREKDKIYFKCKDLQNIFEMNSLCKNVTDNTKSAFIVNTDYLYFKTSDKEYKNIYLTYSGINKLCSFKNLDSNDCFVYLIQIKNNVYKFGKTKHINRRFSDHYRYFNTHFNTKIKLLNYVKLSGEEHSFLESSLKKYIVDNLFNYNLDNCNYSELAVLDKESLKNIQNTYFNKNWIKDNIYLGSNNINIFKDYVDDMLNNKIVDMKNDYKKEIMKLKYENKLLTDKVEHQLEIIKRKEEMLNVYRRLTDK